MGKNCCAIVADSVERSLPPPSQAERKRDTAGEYEINIFPPSDVPRNETPLVEGAGFEGVGRPFHPEVHRTAHNCGNNFDRTFRSGI